MITNKKTEIDVCLHCDADSTISDYKNKKMILFKQKIFTFFYTQLNISISSTLKQLDCYYSQNQFNKFTRRKSFSEILKY